MRKYLLVFIGLAVSLLFLALLSLPDRNLHLIFCDVGQGDAALITLGTTQMLIDGGPDNKVLSCLSRHLPFWDRKIEVVLLTHPQEDHFGGLVDVVRRYQVETLLRPEVEGTAVGWQILLAELHKRNVTQDYAKLGTKIRYSKLQFDIFHPSASLRASPPEDLNEYSIVGQLSFGQFDALLTGDIIPSAIPTFLDVIKPVEVLKVPHHGSKNGLTKELLEKSDPKLAVISVGKNNRYGHPHQEVISLLNDGGFGVMRTDIDGEVEVVSDGQKWWVKR